MTGGAGVGKSFVTRMIIAYLQLHVPITFGTSPVVVCAPTGTAARNIQGQTIHSLLNIPVQRYVSYECLRPGALKRLQQRFANVHTIVIDEISMVSDILLMIISRRLCEIKSSNLPFGGLHIITVGDFFQLKPIKGKYTFVNEILWNDFVPAFLSVNVRQQDDVEYSQLLNRARVGMLSHADVTLLKSRILNDPDASFPNALRIFPTRKQVADHNSKCQSQLTGETCEIVAEHYFGPRDQVPGSMDVDPFLIPEDERDAGGLHLNLRLSVGSRVMLIRNIDTPRGLVNGAMGQVQSFTYIDNVVDTVSVLFDDSCVGQQTNIAGEHTPIPIGRIEHEFMVQGRHIIRQTFPLAPCWACTVHKVQGLSLDEAVIDLGKNIFEPGQSYVALSRVRTISGLCLIGLHVRNVQPSSVVLEQYEKLRDKSTSNKH